MNKAHLCKLTWKLCLILSGLKLLGITTTPLWTLKRRATWALLLLYFFPIDTSSSSSSRGGHFTFTLTTDENTNDAKKETFIEFFMPFSISKCVGYVTILLHTMLICVTSAFVKVLLCLEKVAFPQGYIPGCISRGTKWAVANNHNVILTAVLQKLGLCEIWMALNLQVFWKRKHII